MIYLISNAQQNICKIGHSQNPKARLANLQTATPCPLRLIGTLPGAKVEEKELHVRFAAHHVAGEWFNLVPEIIEAFQEITEDDDGAINFSGTAFQRMSEMTAYGRRAMGFVLSRMQNDTQYVRFSAKECQEYCQFKHLSQAYEGLNALLEKQFVAKSSRRGVLLTNPALIHKGIPVKSTHQFA